MTGAPLVFWPGLSVSFSFCFVRCKNNLDSKLSKSPKAVEEFFLPGD